MLHRLNFGDPCQPLSLDTFNYRSDRVAYMFSKFSARGRRRLFSMTGTPRL
jgi:hypothetical protein